MLTLLDLGKLAIFFWFHHKNEWRITRRWLDIFNFGVFRESNHEPESPVGTTYRSAGHPIDAPCPASNFKKLDAFGSVAALSTLRTTNGI